MPDEGEWQQTETEWMDREEIDQDRIRLLAYALYEKRGRVDGSALDDWLLAESELTAKKRFGT